MQRMHIWAGAAVGVVVLSLVAWLLLQPGWAVNLVQQQAQQQLGRQLEVKGGAHLEFSPLAIRFDQVSMGAGAEQEGSFLTAKSVHIPVNIGQLLTRNADLSSIHVEGGEIALLIDERGRASWSFPETVGASGFSVEIANGTLRYFDARNGQSLMLEGVSAIAATDADGGLSLKGTSELRGRLARIEATLKSLPRVHADGSPADLAIETPEGSVIFSGRIATAKVLSLAGSVTVASPDLRSAARWMGLKVDDGTTFNHFSIDGALDTAGRAIGFRKANVTIDRTTFSGDVTLDLRNAAPKLQAVLTAPSLAIDRFLPPTGAKTDEWGNSNLGFQSLRAFDAEVTVETQALTYGTSAAMPARLGASLAKGKLTSTIAVLPEPGATLVLGSSIDAAVLPPIVSLDVKAEGVDAAAVLPELLGVRWLAGKGSINASLSGAGQTQQEIIGTLKGSANLSLANGGLRGVDLKAMMGGLSQRILEGWMGEPNGNSAYSDLKAMFTVADGIAALGSFEFKTPELTVAASGEIDMLRRAVDLRFEPKQFGADGSVSDFPVGIIARGPWGAPRIYPDVPGIIENPAQGFETLKTMSLSSTN